MLHLLLLFPLALSIPVPDKIDTKSKIVFEDEIREGRNSVDLSIPSALIEKLDKIEGEEDQAKTIVLGSVDVRLFSELFFTII